MRKLKKVIRLNYRTHIWELSFELEPVSSNAIMRHISRSATRDGRFQSYLALGGPAWLHDRLLREAA